MIAPRVFASLLLVGIVTQFPADPAAERNVPLGLDLYMSIQEDNPLSGDIHEGL